MKVGITAVSIAILALVVGCGTSTPNPGKVVPGTGPGPAYVYEVSWHGEVYDVSKNISKVGKQIGVVEERVTKYHVSKSDKTISNFATVGSNIFSVPGVSTSKAVALEYPKGRYWEAFAYKNQQRTS